MRLYLVQHGLAKTAGEDPQRGLSPQGEVEVSAMANWAGNAGIAVKQIQHSGKLRAEQTATILAAQLNPADGVIAIDGLAPNDDVTSFAGRIDSASGDLMLVGHLPFLGRLTA
ncbi:MAG TPA: phosphohistidine phosphatase SixA, partial [Thiotrichales bacterium]|nr:phosphohistidine phosphatase SixA [Thiotrichales bacterium]